MTLTPAAGEPRPMEASGTWVIQEADFSKGGRIRGRIHIEAVAADALLVIEGDVDLALLRVPVEGSVIEVEETRAGPLTSAPAGEMQMNFSLCTNDRNRFLTATSATVRVVTLDGQSSQTEVERIACRLSENRVLSST